MNIFSEEYIMSLFYDKWYNAELAAGLFVLGTLLMVAAVVLFVIERRFMEWLGMLALLLSTAMLTVAVYVNIFVALIVLGILFCVIVLVAILVVVLTAIYWLQGGELWVLRRRVRMAVSKLPPSTRKKTVS